MSIDKVYIFTIDRAKERQLISLGSLFSMEVPQDRIEFFIGADYEEYDSIHDVCDAAISDGFSMFKKTKADNHDLWTHACIAQQWSYMHLWRRIADNNETSMILHDDVLLRMKFDRYQHIVARLNDVDPKWRLLNLLSYTSLKDWNREGFGNFNHMMFKGIVNHCYDQALVINTRFVEWIMNSPYADGYNGLDSFFVEIESNPKYKIFTDHEGIWTLPEELSVTHIPYTISLTTKEEGYDDQQGWQNKIEKYRM